MVLVHDNNLHVGMGNPMGAVELTVSLGKTVDCIVSSKGEDGSTTIQSTTSASRTALF